MGFKRIYTSGSSSLSGSVVTAEHIKPSAGAARYIEIGHADMIPTESATKTGAVRYGFPEITVVANRPSPFGRCYMLVFHPSIGRAPMVIEGEIGADIMSDVGTITEAQASNSWIARIYEFDTTCK